MIKRSMVLIMVLVLVVSFSAVALAEGEEGKTAGNDEAGVRILVEEEDETKIYFLDAVSDDSQGKADNPILVAGS